MQLSRDAIQRMIGQPQFVGTVQTGGGGDSGAGNYVSKDYFNMLFEVNGNVLIEEKFPGDTDWTVLSTDDITFPPNEILSENPEITVTEDEQTHVLTRVTRTITDIEVKDIGLWTEKYISALGQNSSGGGGGGGTGDVTWQALKDANPDITQRYITWPYISAAVGAQNFATQTWVGQQGFATQQWVQQQGYLTGINASMINTALGFTITGTTGASYNLGDFMTQTAADNRYLTIAFFSSLFKAYTSGNAEVTPNAGDTSTIDNIKAMFGFWTDQYVSALGQNSSGGGGGGGTGDVTWQALADNTDTRPISWSHISAAVGAQNYLTSSALTGYATQSWVTSQGYLTSASLSDYATQTWVGQNYLALAGGTMANTNVVTNMNADLLDGTHLKDIMHHVGNNLFDNTGGFIITEVNNSAASNPFEGTWGMVLQWCTDPDVTPDTVNQHNWVYQLVGMTDNRLYFRNRTNGGEWTTAKKIAFTTDNVASATKLQTARTLWGQSFDGTANVSGNMTDVGTISASGNITVTKTTGADTAVSVTNTNGTIALLTSANRGLYDTDTWVIGTNGTNTWLSRGNVGIGTQSPSVKLDVNGAVKASRFYLYKPNADDTGAVYFVYDANGGVQLVGAGLWTESFISALGQNSSGGGGGTGDVTWTALASTAASGRYIDWSYISDAVGAQSFATESWVQQQGYLSSVSFSDISGQATAAQVPNIENLTNFSARVYDATTSRTKNTVLAAPNGQNGVATFRALVAADLPDLSGMYAAAGRVSTLEGYFTNGVANEAAKLSTVSKTAWGQTYWTSNGVPDSVSGNMTGVGTISASGNITVTKANGNDTSVSVTNTNGTIALLTSTNRGLYDNGWLIATNGTDTWLSRGNVGIGTTVPGVKLDVNGAVKASRFYLYKPNADNDTGAVYFVYDSNGGVQLVGAGLWTNSFISALGQNSSGGGGGGGGTGDVTWTALADNTDQRQVAASHLSTALADYLPLSGGTLTGELKVVNSSQAGFHFYTATNNGAAIIDAYGTSDIEIYGDVYMSSNLDVDGTISQGSDMRRKDVIDEDALLAVSDIANAPAIHFTWKDKADKEHHVGTSAQYWQTLMPEAVHEDKNGYLSMQYDVLAMLGVISVARKVVSHEERIAALEAENERLKKEIEQLKS